MGKNVEEIVYQARDEASQAIRNIAGELGNVGNVLTRLGGLTNPIALGLAAIGAAAGGIVLVGSGVSDAVEQLDKLSSATGVSVEALQVFREEIKEAGGDPESLVNALRFLNRAIATQDPLLAQLGITTHDTKTAFMQLAQAFEGSSDSAKKNEIAFKLLGRGAGDLVGILPKLASGFSGMRSAMDQAGNLMKGETLDAARVLDSQMDTLSRNWEGALTRIKSATVPWANDIVREFDDVWNAIGHKGQATLPEIDRQIAGVESDIKKMLAEINKPDDDPTALQRVFGTPAQRKAAADAALDDFEKQLKRLNDLRAKMAPGDAAALRNARENVEGGAAEDPLKKALVGDELTAAEDRKKRLKDLAGVAKDLGLTAEQVAASLDKIEADHKTDSVRRELFPDQAKAIDDLKELNKRIEDAAPLFDGDRAAAARYVDQLAELEKHNKLMKLTVVVPPKSAELTTLLDDIDTVGKLLDVDTEAAARFVAQLDEVEKRQKARDLRKQLGIENKDDKAADVRASIDDVKRGMEDVVGLAGIVHDTFENMFSSLAAGFNDVFHQIIDGSATAGSILKTLWHSVVETILQELSRILAAKAILFVLKFLTHGPIATAAEELIPEAITSAKPEAAPESAKAPAPALPPASATVQKPDEAESRPAPTPAPVPPLPPLPEPQVVVQAPAPQFAQAPPPPAPQPAPLPAPLPQPPAVPPAPLFVEAPEPAQPPPRQLPPLPRPVEQPLPRLATTPQPRPQAPAAPRQGSIAAAARIVPDDLARARASAAAPKPPTVVVLPAPRGFAAAARLVPDGLSVQRLNLASASRGVPDGLARPGANRLPSDAFAGRGGSGVLGNDRDLTATRKLTEAVASLSKAIAAQKPAQPATGDTVINVQAISAGDALTALVGPSAPLRRAYDRLAIGSAY